MWSWRKGWGFWVLAKTNHNNKVATRIKTTISYQARNDPKQVYGGFSDLSNLNPKWAWGNGLCLPNQSLYPHKPFYNNYVLWIWRTNKIFQNLKCKTHASTKPKPTLSHLYFWTFNSLLSLSLKLFFKWFLDSSSSFSSDLICSLNVLAYQSRHVNHTTLQANFIFRVQLH
jgi:hypothetical protein